MLTKRSPKTPVAPIASASDAPSFTRSRTLAEHALQARALDLLGERAERLDQRDAGADQRRELARRERQVERRDAAQEASEKRLGAASARSPRPRPRAPLLSERSVGKTPSWRSFARAARWFSASTKPFAARPAWVTPLYA